MQQEASALEDVLGHLRSNRRLVIGTTLVAAIAAGLWTLITPAQYRAEATLLMPSAQPSNLSGLASLAIAQGPSPLSMLRGVMTSRSARDSVAKATGLSREKVAKVLEVITVDDQGQLRLTATYVDKDVSLEAIQSAIDTLARLDRDAATSIAGRQAKVLEGVLAEKKKELDAAEQRLVKFQKTASTVPDPVNAYSAAQYLVRLKELEMEKGGVDRHIESLRSDAESIGKFGRDLPSGIPAIATLRAKFLAAEARLAAAQGAYGPKTPQVLTAKGEVDTLTRQLSAEVGKYLASIDKGLIPEVAELRARQVVLEWQIDALRKAASQAPQEAVAFQNLIMEVTVAAKTYQGIRENYERARIESETDKVRWEVLDEPWVDPRPVNKSLIRNVALATIFGLFLGCAGALVSRRRD